MSTVSLNSNLAPLNKERKRLQIVRDIGLMNAAQLIRKQSNPRPNKKPEKKIEAAKRRTTDRTKGQIQTVLSYIDSISISHSNILKGLTRHE